MFNFRLLLSLSEYRTVQMMTSQVFVLSSSHHLLTKFPTTFPRPLKRRRNAAIDHHTLNRLHPSSTVFAKAVDFKPPATLPQPPELTGGDTTLLLDVSGMMCGGCVSRVDAAVVNMLTETAAIKLKKEGPPAGEDIAGMLAEFRFPAKVRESGLGIKEKVKKWKETVVKKEALVVESRNRVAFAWTLVALCCGSHASHILHSLGIHIAHGTIFEVLHNSYVKGGLALGSLLGPGRGYHLPLSRINEHHGNNTHVPYLLLATPLLCNYEFQLYLEESAQMWFPGRFDSYSY